MLSSADRIFDTGECSAAADTQAHDCYIHWRCAVICYGEALGCWVSSRRRSLQWAPAGSSIQSYLWRKLSCCWKYCIAKFSSQRAADGQHCGHKLGSVKTFLYEHLLITKICARWVPKMFDQKMKIVDAKSHTKIWSSCSWTGICLWGA